MRQKILVVDDEQFIVELIADVLEDEGYSVARAYDGDQAAQIIDRQPPDLVIADIMMPRLDGVSLLQQIRQRHGSLPVLLMTAVRRPDDLDAPVLSKPFDLQDLLTMVEQMTANGGVAIGTGGDRSLRYGRW